MAKSPKKSNADQEFNPKVLEATNQSLRQIATGLGFIALQMSSLKDKKNPEKIQFLSKFGFDRHQIAAIIDSTVSTVSKELSILKLKSPADKEESQPQRTDAQN
jgi:hypothetical protein